MFGDDVWRADASAEAVRLAEALEAPVFASRQIFVNFPNRHALYCGTYPVAKDFETVTGLRPDVLFMVGCQGVHGAVNEPSVIQIGPNPVLMGRHYPLDVAAQCELRDTLRALTEALKRRPGADAWTRQRAKVRAYARTLIEREEKLVREHSDDAIVHPAVLEAQLAEMLPREAVMVQESSTARTALIPSPTMAEWTRRRRLLAGAGGRGPHGAKTALGTSAPCCCTRHGALTYSPAASGRMARYRPGPPIVSKRDLPDRAPNWATNADARWCPTASTGLFFCDPATDDVCSQSRRAWTARRPTVKDLERRCARARRRPPSAPVVFLDSPCA